MMIYPSVRPNMTVYMLLFSNNQCWSIRE